MTPRRLCREGVGGVAGGFPGVRGVPGPPRRFPLGGPWPTFGGARWVSRIPLVASATSFGGLRLSRRTFWRFGGRVGRLCVSLGPHRSQNECSLSVPGCAWTTLFQAKPWFGLVQALYTKSVHNDAQRCPKGPQKSSKAPQSLPKGA